MAGTLCKGDVGTNLDFTIEENGSAVDISGGTIAFVLVFPSGVRKSFSASVQDGPNGLARYTTQADDIPEAGQVQAQVQMTLGSWVGCSSIADLLVIEKL